MAALRRGFVEVDGALIHYREAGSADAPALVMLHDSPRSSRLHNETMLALAARFHVVALDTPGYGNSDALAVGDAAPTIPDFGAALGRALTALGLANAPLYATHTSAKIALAHVDAGGAPSVLVLDGLSMPETLADEAFIAAYMRPFDIDDAGAYLAREWSRTRDMLRWFPWFATTADKRIPMAAPDPAWMQDYVIDLMSAGSAYSGAYAAAMRYDPAPALARVAVPTVVAARADDVLHGFLTRAEAVGSAQVTVQSLPANRDAWLAWLEATIDAAQAPAVALPPAAGRALRAYVDLDHGQMHILRFGANDTPAANPVANASGPQAALVIGAPTALHAAAWGQALAPHMIAIVPELPGLGESDPLPAPSAETIADALAQMLERIAVGPVAVLAIGWAAPLGAMLAARHPDRVVALAVDGAPPLDPARAAALVGKVCPAFGFDHHAGSHLHQIWHYLRDSEAQWPWHETSLDAIRRLPPLFDGTALHEALTGIIKQPDHWGDATAAALTLSDPAAVWGAVAAPLLAFAHADPAHAEAAALAALAPQGHVHPRPDALDQAARAFVAFCAGTGAGTEVSA